MDGGFGTTGTVRHDRPSPAYALHQSVARPPQSASNKSLRYTETARILRAHRLDELLAGIAEWQRSTGPERSYARRNAAHDLAAFKRRYLAPERAAFLAAVAASQHRRETP